MVVVALVCAAAAWPSAAQNPAINPRIALVVGNATYRDRALATTANDAGLVAQTLQAAGFDVIGARDLDGQSLRTALRDFLDKAAAAGPDLHAFVYLAGRGIQYNGDNYFVPVDAEIRRDADAPIEAVRVSDFVHALATLPGRARIVVLDAARANPYAAEGAPLAPGLALVEPEPGVLIAFNAAPGTLAGDEQGPYGVFGKTLAGAMRQGGVDIAEVFDQTRILVNQETEGALLPWSASKLDGPSFIFERAADAPPPPVLSAAQTAGKPLSRFPAEQAYAVALQRDTIAAYREYLAAFPNSDQARRVRAILAVRREAEFWRRTLDANTPRAYWTYLRLYPRGPHVADARRRLAILSAQFAPPADFEPMEFGDLPPPPPDERFYEDRPVYAFSDFGPPPPPPPVYYDYDDSDEWRDLPPPPPPVAVGVLPALEIAIPLFVGAVAYRGHEHRHDRDGLAPPGAPRLAPPPPAPPPMPAHVRPVAPPPPRPVAAAAAGVVVKPLPPIGRPPQGGRQPHANGPSPGFQPVPALSNPPSPPTAGAQSVAPVGKPLPAPRSNAANPPPNAPIVAPGGKPPPAPANGANPPAVPSGGKPAVPGGANPLANPPAAVKPAPPPAGLESAKPLQPLPSPNPGSLPTAPKPPDLRKAAPVGSPQTLPPAAPAIHPPAQLAPPPAAHAPIPAPAPPAAAVHPIAPPAAPTIHPPAQLAPPPAAHAPIPAPVTGRPIAPPAAPAVHPPAQFAPAPHAPIPAPAPPAAAVHPIAPPAAPVIHPPAQLAPPPPAALAPAPVRPPALPAAPAIHAPAQPGGKPGLAPQGPPKAGQPPG